MNAIRLSEAQWEAIRPLLPPPPRMGRPCADDRAVLEAIPFCDSFLEAIEKYVAAVGTG